MRYYEEHGYVYPSRSDEHMIEVKKLRDITFDENYPYVDKSFWFKVKRVFFWIMLNPLVFFIATCMHGIKIYGRKQFKANKHLFKDGVITISNHVYMWDYLSILKAIRPHIGYFPAWKTNLNGSNGGFIRLAGGIPIPTENIKAMVKFKKEMDQILIDKKWMHFYPEGSMWYFYPDIRPLKKAVFKLAVEHNKPILPITISFRKRRGIYRLFGKKPCSDVHIGEPIFPDLTLPKDQAVDKLHKEAYHIMQVMNGINPGDPTYNTNQNIDDYKCTVK